MLRQFIVFISGILLVQCLAAQTGCPSIDVGPDLTVDCDNPCVSLSSDVFETGSTNTYSVESIPYAPPFPINGGTSLFIGVDDTWSNAINLPFEFCFFGINYNQIVVGSNGIITFDASEANGLCPWAFTDAAPSPFLPTNAIFAPYMDINPAECGAVRFQLLGNAPCRTFVVNYDNVCLYSCTSSTVQAQIVFYETTNAIETYIGNKPACGGWNSGNTLVGIQNNAGTVAYVPPGRNTGNWSTSTEAWRFTPSGAPIYTINWYENGDLMGSGNPFEVCPTEDATYTGEVVYDSCGGTISLSDDVNVVVEGVLSDETDPAILSEDLFICSTANLTPVEVLVAGGELSSDCNCLNGFDVNPALAEAGIYTITHTLEGECGPITDSISLEIELEQNSEIVQPENVCNSVVEVNIETVTQGGNFSSSCADCIDEISGAFSPSSAGIGEHTVTYTFSGNCPSSSEVQITVNQQSDATFALQDFLCSSSPFANANPNELNGNWTANCADCIDDNGNLDLSSSIAGEYIVTHTIEDECPNESSLPFEYVIENNPDFNLAEVACESDQEFILDALEENGVWTSNCGNCIDNSTFDPNAAGAGIYTVSYSFGGLCPTSSSEIINVSEQLSAQFSALSDLCTNDLAVQIVPNDVGGVYSASCGICLSETGEFDPSIAGAGIHTVSYTIAGSCGDTHSEQVSVEQSLDATISDPGTFCLGVGDVQLVAAEGGGTWSATCGTCINPTSGVFNTMISGTGNFTVSYELVGFCGDTDSAEITITQNTASTFTLPPGLCVNNNSSSFLPQNPNGTWSSNCGECLNPDGIFSPSLAGIGTHEITYSINGVCGTSSIQNIEVHPLPNPDFSLSDFEGCAPLNVEAFPEQIGTQCFWNFGNNSSSESCTNPNFTFVSPGCHNIEYTIIDNNGCINSQSIENAVCIFANPHSGYTFGPENPTTDQPFINLYENATEANLIYEWTLNDEYVSSDSLTTMDLSDFGGSSAAVCLRVIDQNNCFDVECKEIEVIQNLEVYIPNTFTPNGDNINDIWHPHFLGVEEYELFVFSRWGEIVFHSTDPKEVWTGNVNGSDHFAGDGMYHYRLKILGQDHEGKDFTGFVLLLR